jgi:hypothetical protein
MKPETESNKADGKKEKKSRWPDLPPQVEEFLMLPMNIIKIISLGSASAFYFNHGKTEMPNVTFKELQKRLLNKIFLRVNCILYVNMYFITKLEYNGKAWEITIQENEVYEITETYKKEFMKKKCLILRIVYLAKIKVEKRKNWLFSSKFDI